MTFFHFFINLKLKIKKNNQKLLIFCLYCILKKKMQLPKNSIIIPIMTHQCIVRDHFFCYYTMIRLVWFPKARFKSIVTIVTFLQIFFYLFSLLYDLNWNFSELLAPSQNSLFKLGEKYPYFIAKQLEVYRLFTSPFLHANLHHLIVTILSNYSISAYVEDFLGKKHFLFLIFFGCASASIFSSLLSDDPGVGGSFVALVCGGCLGGLELFYARAESRKKIVTEKSKLYFIITNKMKEFNFVLIFFGLLNSIIPVTSKTIDNYGVLGASLHGYIIGFLIGTRDQYFYPDCTHFISYSAKKTMIILIFFMVLIIEYSIFFSLRKPEL